MKKYKTLFLVVLIAAVFGFMMSFFIHSGLWDKLGQSIKSFKFYWYILFPFIIFFLTILVHELGHLFSFLFQGVKIRALYVLIFIFMKDSKNKFKFKIKFSNIKLLGGFVVPNLPEIDNDNKFEEIRTKFAKAIKHGPITSIWYCVISILLFFIVWFFSGSYFMITLLLLNAVLTLLFTLLIIKVSKLNNDMYYGDYVAYEKIMNDETFTLLQINQYLMFSLISTPLSEEYIYERIINTYQKKEFVSYKLFDLNIISSYIGYNIRLDEQDRSLKEYIDKYNIQTVKRFDYGFEFGLLLSSYYYKMGEVKKSYEIFEQFEYLGKDNFEKTLLVKLYEHIINLSDNTELLIENKNKLFADYDLLLPLINTDDLFEEMIVRLPLQVYLTEILTILNK